MEPISLEPSDTADVENSKFGEKLTYDASGPYQKTRTKTDFCWLVGFIVYVLIWSAVIMYAYSAGDTRKWLRPKDSAGRICGYDSDVQNKPYHMIYDSDSCTSSHCWVCLSHCPDNDFEFDYEVESTTAIVVTRSTADSTTTEQGTTVSNDLHEEKQAQKTNSSQDTSLNDAQKSQQEKQQSESSDKSEGSDKPREGTTESNVAKNSTASASRAQNNEDQNTQISMSSLATTTTTTTTQSSDESTTANGSSSPTSTTEFDRMRKSIICQSDVRVESIDQWEDLKYLIDRGKCSKSYRKADCLNVTSGVVADVLKRSIKFTIASELAKTKFSVLIGFLVLSAAITLAIILLMRWCAMAYVCTSIITICALLFYWIYCEFVYEAESKATGVLIALLLGALVLVVIIAIAMHYARQISLACQMIAESSRAFTCVLSSVAVPIIFLLIYALIFVLGASVFLLLMSIETPVHRADFAPMEKCKCPVELAYWQNATCDPSTFESRCRKPNGDHCILSGCYMVGKESAEGFGHFVNCLGLSWSFYFFAGFNDMVLGSLFSTWYWTFNKKLLSCVNLVESFWRISAYHLGTIALGSLLIIATSLVRTIVNSVKSILEKSKGPCAAAALSGLQYLFVFMESFVDFIDRKAYIMCAMHGTDYIQSARAAYYLMKRNVSRVFAVITVTRYFTFITTILVACLTAMISMNYYVIDQGDRLKMDFIPIVIVFLGSCAITLMLMRVVEIAVETVFLCFLEDIERNDGTDERPYFMSEQLTKFLYKQ